ncbi:hypothetical protein LJC58_00790 [Lachnospiraceae bacterium OttesenSCG-928-D06]|nr:hypothetical protein [Lachnospiraceae bacterium OttesenSCG-928-D06]
MGFFRNLFKRKEKKVIEEQEWDQVVYVRDQVNFHVEIERSRYVTNCLEQMAEASREIETLTSEYNQVTSYLTDMEEIEALPGEEKEEIKRIATNLQALSGERDKYKGKKNRMPDGEFYKLRGIEDQMEEGIKKLREAEEYHVLIKQDMQRLDGERHAYEYRSQELIGLLENYKGMAVIFLTALVLCIALLFVLQFAFSMNTTAGYMIAIVSAVAAIVALSLKYTDSEKERIKVEKSINKLILLQNKVKIRYVNSINLLDYLCLKYDTDCAATLERKWKKYQKEKEERKEYAETESKLEYYQRQLINELYRFRVQTPSRFIHQINALLDKREMVELRHELILQRQSLRKQLDYNNEVGKNAKTEIIEVSKSYPEYAAEIMEMVDKYETSYEKL